MVYGLILASVQKIRGGKVTFDVLDLWPEHFYTFLSKKQRWFFFPLILFLRLERSISFYLADLIFFCSEEYSYEAGSFLQSAKKRVRYIGTDFNDSIDDIKTQKKTNRVCRFLYAGTFGESYDVQSLIQAIMLLIDEGLDFEVYFAGDGPLRNDIVELAKNYPKYVRFVGLLGPDSLFEELLMADVGLCCYAENSRVSMPLKFFDYVANQIYVLNSLTGEINDWLNDLGLGMSYEAGNISSLKTAMTEIIHGELWLKVDWKTKRKLLYRFDASNETEKMANEIVEL
jgi:glycosyltransferase involved in cell wall biosynthesis